MVLEHFSKISLTLGAIVMICFFLPWLNIGCGNVAIVKLSGYGLTTGHIELEQDAVQRQVSYRSHSGGDSYALQSEHQVRPQLYLLLIVVCAVGMIVYSVRMLQELDRIGMYVIGACGIFGVLLLTVAASRDFGVDLPADIARTVHISHPPAFFLSEVCFVSAILLSAFGIWRTMESTANAVLPRVSTSVDGKVNQVPGKLPGEEKSNFLKTTNAFGEPLVQTPPESEQGMVTKICSSCGSVVSIDHTTCQTCGNIV